VQTTDILPTRLSPIVLPKTEGEAVFESPGIASTSDDDDVAGSVSKGDVQAFARKSFGPIASPFLSPFVHRRGVLDAEYGLRKIDNRFFLDNSDAIANTKSDLYIRHKHFKGTRDLWELLTRK
jgi:hypothetical protein